MTNIERLKDRLKNIFNKEEHFVVTLNGQWGVGKTYFWNKFSEECLENKSVAYVSLFGKNSIQDIRADISFQVAFTKLGSKKSQTDIKTVFKKIDQTIGKLKFLGIDLSSVISALTKEDFKNIIICFDDFERLSGQLKLKDVLGLISELKEQKKCKVMMILNQEELGKSVDALSKYKDKIIDYEFQYNPAPFESLNLVQDKLDAFKDYPLEDYFQRKNINNIRIIKRVIDALNDFGFIEEEINHYINIQKEIVGSIIEISTINA